VSKRDGKRCYINCPTIVLRSLQAAWSVKQQQEEPGGLQRCAVVTMLNASAAAAAAAASLVIKYVSGDGDGVP